MAINEKKLGKKIFVTLTLQYDGVMYSNFVTSAQAQYLPCLKKDGTPGWAFDQFEGDIYTSKDGKLVPTGAKWYWGVDWKVGSRNYGRMYRDLGKEGDPYKVVLMAHGRVPFDPWGIADAVHDVVMAEKKATQSKPQVDAEIMPEIKEPLMLPAPQIVSRAIQEAIEVDAEDDVSIINGMGESPIDRLQAGDPSWFVELGAPQKYAERWAQQIRDGSVTINGIEDVMMIRGIGKKIAEKLIIAWHEKFE